MSMFVGDLDTVERQAWDLLRAGVGSHRAAFHSGTLTTVGRDGRPQARTVILRAAERSSRLLAFHTDRRSPKVEELLADACVGWLFYDEPSRMQLRIEAVATLHQHDARADQHWAATTLDSRRAYAARAAPGSPLTAAGDGLSDACEKSRWSLESSEGFRPNFVVVTTQVTRLEVLVLSHHGHRRAAFDYAAERRLHADWLIP